MIFICSNKQVGARDLLSKINSREIFSKLTGSKNMGTSNKIICIKIYYHRQQLKPLKTNYILLNPRYDLLYITTTGKRIEKTKQNNNNNREASDTEFKRLQHPLSHSGMCTEHETLPSHAAIRADCSLNWVIDLLTRPKTK